MKRMPRFSPLAAPLLLALVAAWAQAAPAAGGDSDPRGRWITANGNLEVEVAPCGSALCGTVTRVLANHSMSSDGAAMDAVDKRPALGMTILHDFVAKPADPADTPAREWHGQIYNRENGKTYDCEMSVEKGQDAASELVLRVYVGIRLFGKTQRWQRVKAN